MGKSPMTCYLPIFYRKFLKVILEVYHLDRVPQGLQEGARGHIYGQSSMTLEGSLFVRVVAACIPWLFSRSIHISTVGLTLC